MNQPHNTSFAEGVGRRAGRSSSRLINVTRHFLMRLGLSARTANVVMVVAGLAIAVAFVRHGLWIVPLIGLVAVLLISQATHDLPNPYASEPEWRDGLLGFGLYDAEGTRVDFHDPEHPNQ